MRRRWGTRMFLDRCRLLRDHLDQPALTTDVIVGFPGETEAEFEQTLETCRTAGFSKVHVFPYSQRRGTPAAEMPQQVDKQVQADRVRRLLDLERSLREQYFGSLMGRTLELLVETCRPVATMSPSACVETTTDYVVRGTSCRYAPLELTTNRPMAPGTLVPVSAVASDEEKIIARLTPGRDAISPDANP